MRIHSIKITEYNYENVLNGTKTFEIRLNDRAYQKGDLVILNPVYRDNQLPMFGAKSLTFKIGDVYPIENNKVVFSLLPKGGNNERE